VQSIIFISFHTPNSSHTCITPSLNHPPHFFSAPFALFYRITGEDIGESDDEDDEEGNELEYDEFLRHDNDFGSDADSDGEIASAAAIQRREGIETLGPRFLSANRETNGFQNMRCAIKLDAEFSAVACVEKEKDVVRLRAYHAVVYAQPIQLPYLGGGTYVRDIAHIRA
jgi:hypothetical protein